MSEKTSFVFFGSGPVAAESLRQLSEVFRIEAVVTKPTTKHEMERACNDVTTYTVSDKSELDELFTSQKFDSRVGILIDFGIIVNTKVINYFPLGIINSHFSILPELRGADPISFAILEGKARTGVSLMQLVPGMDEGPIFAVGECPLSGNETTTQLTESLIALSTSLLSESLDDIVNGRLPAIDQKEIAQTFDVNISYTRKLTKEDGRIDWEKSAKHIEREIRAYDAWPKSCATLGDIECVIVSATVISKESTTPGTINRTKKELTVDCGENALRIDVLKPAGKKEMPIAAFLAGYANRLD